MSKDNNSVARSTVLLNTHGGPGLLYTAPLGTPFPTVGMSDILNLVIGVTQFTPKTPWSSLGMTKTGITLTHGYAKLDRTADQVTGIFDSRPTAWDTMITTDLIETTPATLQLGWVGGAINTVAKIATTLTIAAAVGAASVTVALATGLTVGAQVAVGIGSTQELVQVLTHSANLLTFATPAVLAYPHASGELVVQFSTSNVTFGTAKTVPARLLAAIAPMSIDDPTAGGVLSGYRTIAFRRAKVADGQKAMVQSLAADWALPVGFHVFPDPSIADPDQDTFQIWDLGY